jgi:hypothetical protein
VDNALHFLFIAVDVLAEGQVVYNGSGFPSQVAVFIYAADDLFCNAKLPFIQLQHPKLGLKYFVKAGFHLVGHGGLFFLVAVIIVTELVIGNIIVTFLHII